VTRRLGQLRSRFQSWQEFDKRLQEASALAQLAWEEGAEDLAADLERQTAELERELDRREIEVLLSGPHDVKSALLALHAGAGGTDAQDWTEMLLRMYLRWAERRGYEARLLG
jgi:peptide chain release factor 2